MKKIICFMKRYSHIIAVISFLISIVAFGASFRIEPFHVGIESVIGIVTALMGICATFMVGWQVFSSINVNKELENIKLANDELKSKIETLNGLIAAQKEEMTKEGKERCLMKKELDAQLWSAKALSLIDKQYFTTYECYAECLCIYLELQNYERINNALKNMGIALDYINETLETIGDYNSDRRKYDILLSYNGSSKVNSEDWAIKRMSSNPGFQLIRKQVEELEKRRSSLEERVEELKQ